MVVYCLELEIQSGSFSLLNFLFRARDRLGEVVKFENHKSKHDIAEPLRNLKFFLCNTKWPHSL